MMQGDTIEVRYKCNVPKHSDDIWGIGFIEEVPNEYNDTTIFIRNDGYERNYHIRKEPRWFFCVSVDPRFDLIYLTTRMVLTEKNRYIINHGGQSIEDIWME